MGHINITRELPFPATIVWAKITDFENMADWHRSLSTVKIEGARGLGMKRHMWTYAQHEMTEEVTELDDARMTVGTDVFNMPAPFNNLHGSFHVEPTGPASCILHFETEYSIKGGLLGTALDLMVIRHGIRREHTGILEDLEHHLTTGACIGDKGERLPARRTAKAS